MTPQDLELPACFLVEPRSALDCLPSSALLPVGLKLAVLTLPLTFLLTHPLGSLLQEQSRV